MSLGNHVRAIRLILFKQTPRRNTFTEPYFVGAFICLRYTINDSNTLNIMTRFDPRSLYRIRFFLLFLFFFSLLPLVYQ